MMAFALWPTATGSANVQDATYKRDIVRAYVDSFRAQGLKTCLYFRFSICAGTSGRIA